MVAGSEVNEVFARLDALVAAKEETNPWRDDPDPRYYPDYPLMADLVAIPIEAGRAPRTGHLAKAVDFWLAYELRRAGFGRDEVWPRPTEPRVLPRDLATLLDKLPRRDLPEALRRIRRTAEIGPADARVLGRAYVKQVDVVIAQWSRGPELLVSTKTMVASSGKNIFNRFEEAYGDAKNLRGRHPLAAMGFFLLLRWTGDGQAGTRERIVDMLRKLRAERDVYDTTCLVIGEWDDPPKLSSVSIRNDLVPRDLQADAFLSELITAVLDRTPVQMHVDVRQRREHQALAVEEFVEGGETSETDGSLGDDI